MMLRCCSTSIRCIIRSGRAPWNRARESRSERAASCRRSLQPRDVPAYRLHWCERSHHDQPLPTRGGRPLPRDRHRQRSSAHAILIETHARNTGENVTLTRELLAQHDIEADSAMVICRPYQQRRAYATFRASWPELDVVCSSRSLSLPNYIATIGDPHFVIDMIVGDTQRVIEYPTAGFSSDQTVPDSVAAAYRRLVSAGFTSRLIERCGYSPTSPRDIVSLSTRDRPLAPAPTDTFRGALLLSRPSGSAVAFGEP